MGFTLAFALIAGGVIVLGVVVFSGVNALVARWVDEDRKK